MSDPLTRLAILHGTDKFGDHIYSRHYFDLLSDWRNKPIKMLEIGVGGYRFADRGGESLAMWRDFFTEGQITGLDIHEKAMDLGSRVQIIRGSQVDEACLSSITHQRGPFDIILDDGSHLNEHVFLTFDMLFPDLVPGGIYIVEDVQTAFFPSFGGSLQMTMPNTVRSFSSLAACLMAGPRAKGASRVKDIAGIERFHNLIVIHKAAGKKVGFGDDRRIAAARGAGRLISLRADEALTDAATLTRHVMEAGHGAVLAIEGKPQHVQLMLDVFTQIDHSEIRVNYPDAKIHDVARHISAMAFYRDGIVLQIGDNTYPSHFKPDPAHPEFLTTLALIGEVVEEGAASTTGILRHAGMLRRYVTNPDLTAHIQRLAAMGCTDRRYFVMASQERQSAADWPGVIQINQHGLRHFPGDEQMVAMLSKALIRTGRAAEAEHILGDALAKAPRSATILNAMAHLAERLGRIDQAISLRFSMLKTIPPRTKPHLLRSLIQYCRNNGELQKAYEAAAELLALVPDDFFAREVIELQTRVADLSSGDLPLGDLSDDSAGSFGSRSGICAKN